MRRRDAHDDETMKTSHLSPVTVRPSPVEATFDPDDLIPLSEAARMLGESIDNLRRGYCAAHGLTLIDDHKPGAQRRRFKMVRGEVIAHRQKMIQNARERMNVRAWEPKVINGNG